MPTLDTLFSSVGDPATWTGGVAPVKSVTDLSDHVDGGPKSSAGTNAAADARSKMVLYGAAGVVAVATILLWVMGGSFRAIRL